MATIGTALLKIGLDKMQGETLALGGSGGVSSLRGLTEIDSGLPLNDQDVLFYKRDLGRITSGPVQGLSNFSHIQTHRALAEATPGLETDFDFHSDAGHDYGTGNPGGGGIQHSHSVNYDYASTRRTTTYTNATTTFTDILTLVDNPQPRFAWAYILCYVDASTTTGALRLFDKTGNVLYGSPHPDVELQINHTAQVSDCLMGELAFTFPITAHTHAIQGRVTATGAGQTLTVLKAGYRHFVPTAFTGPPQQ